MSAHDEAFLDSIAVLALGALPAAEARELAAHVATCAECRQEYDALRGAANAVGYGAEIEAGELGELPAARLKASVMRAVRAAPANGSNSVSAGRPHAMANAGGWPARSWIAYGAAAAAIVVALLTSANDATLRTERAHALERIAQLEASVNAGASESAAAQARAVALLAPDSKRFAVPGGDVVTSGGRVYLAMRHMAPPPAGKVYQVWTLASGAKAVAPSVTFVPGAGGVSVIELPERAAGLAAVAVSVEPTGGSKVPTSKPSFVRSLT